MLGRRSSITFWSRDVSIHGFSSLGHEPAEPGRPVRRVRRALCARVPGPGLCRPGGGVPGSVGRPGLPRPAVPAPHRICGPPHRPHPGVQPLRGARRDAPAQAGGPGAHRLPQNQQRARPGTAGTADGQDPPDRRDRRRPARCRHRHRGGPVRHARHRLHGRARHRAAAPQRLPDGVARRRGDPGDQRQPHLEGRHQRGYARLGRRGRRRALLSRLGRRAAPLPVAGP